MAPGSQTIVGYRAECLPTRNSLRIVQIVEDDEAGHATVEFIAKATVCGKVLSLHEKSRFVREDGRRLHIDGEVKESTDKPGRNQPCPCGSGKKFKKCCGP